MKSKRRIFICCIMSLMLALVMAMPAGVSAEVEDGYAAKTDNKVYTTLQDAINDISEDTSGEIVLVANIKENVKIPAGKTIVLDLGGFKITNDVGDHTITNDGNLTIKGNGTIDNVTHGWGALKNNGTVELMGGTLTRSKEASRSPSDNGGNSWYVIDNHGTLTIDGGNVINNSKYSSLIRNLGTLEMVSGNVENDFIAIKNDEDVAANKKGQLNVTGGTITSAEQSVQNWADATIVGGKLNGAVITWSYGNSQGKTEINDGAVINGKVAAVDYGGSSVSSEVTIKGGIINGILEKATHGPGLSYNPVDPTADVAAEIKVTGGEYTEQPDNAFIGDSVAAIEYVHDGVTKYYIGSEAEINDIVKDAAKGDKIVVLTGDINVLVKGDGVNITNKGDGTVTVNGVELGQNGITTGPQEPSENPGTQTPAGDKTDSTPKTSDDMNLFVPAIVLLAAAAAGTLAVTTRRRHNN